MVGKVYDVHVKDACEWHITYCPVYYYYSLSYGENKNIILITLKFVSYMIKDSHTLI